MSKHENDTKHEVSHPSQLSFFKLIGRQFEDYSNTIELYDVLPKYYAGNVKRINNKFLDEVEREFVFRGKKHKIIIKPSIIEDSEGEKKAYYPAQREEVVEDALKKLATEKGGVFIGDTAGVKFSLYELEKELKKRGHGYNKSQIKEAIKVCQSTAIVLKSEDHAEEISFHIFEAIGFSSTGQRDKENNKAFVKFNSLVTKSINEKTFRLFNYKLCMSLKYMLSRWLFKRISHHFLQATVSNPYQIKLTTIIRDSGIADYPRLTDSRIQVKKTLDELCKAKILQKYEEGLIYNEKKRNKLDDVIFSLWLTETFCKDIKKANYMQGQIQTEEIDEAQEELLDYAQELKTEMQKDIFGLSKKFLDGYVNSIKDKQSFKESITALAAAKELIGKYESKGEEYQAAAITKRALKDKWLPVSNQYKSHDEVQQVEIEQGFAYNSKDKEIFEQFNDFIAKELGLDDYNNWFKSMNLISSEPLVYEVKSKFVKEWIENNFDQPLSLASKKIFKNDEYQINILVI